MKDLLGREEALNADEARKRLLDQAVNMPAAETLSIDSAYGMVLARDVIAPGDLPGFTRSVMDGFAVNAADTFGASDTMPVYLDVRGQVVMGQRPSVSIMRGEALSIPTGGMLPNGADAVVMLEHTNMADENMVEVMKALAPWENVIRTDEDLKKGERVIAAGKRLRPQDIGALAGMGIVEVDVFRKPAVAIIGTGDEVVPPERVPAPGEVRDINSYNLAGLIMGCGARPVKLGIVRDDLDTLKKVLEEAVRTSDMVLITGGSSVGARDFTAQAINEQGRPGVLFHGVAMKPGKPLIGGIVNGVPVFGLPGHPAAITVSFETIVEPLLLRMTGETIPVHLPARRLVRAIFSRNLSSSLGREEHIRVSLEKRQGALWAAPVLGKSGLVRTLVQADGIVIVPMNKSGLYEGEEVEVRLFK
ncbi:MAG: molybdopterin molybdotransferase MoeA [Nitrospiraceae bacterium]|nr:MAG: molybdopterin molybdotransferase MoeA [Nitrospiraceae bacterium]